MKIYKFESVIEAVPDQGGAYVRVPFDIRNEFGKDRVKVSATFNSVPYSNALPFHIIVCTVPHHDMTDNHPLKIRIFIYRSE